MRALLGPPALRQPAFGPSLRRASSGAPPLSREQGKAYPILSVVQTCKGGRLRSLLHPGVRPFSLKA
jgi:hypothetical protein